MKSRLLLLFVFFMSIQIVGGIAFISVANSSPNVADIGMDEEDSSDEEKAAPIEEEQPADEVTQKVEAILAGARIREEATDYIKKYIQPQHEVFEAKLNQKKGNRFFKSYSNSGHPFDFSDTPPDTRGMMVSSVAALNYCGGKTDQSSRYLSYRTFSNSRTKNLIKKGLTMVAKKGMLLFSMPVQTVRTTTCSKLQSNFCQRVCERGVCGADALIGATCVKVCWKGSLMNQKKLGYCREDFANRFVYAKNSAMSKCRVKHLHNQRKGKIRKLFNWATGETETLELADRCQEIMESGQAQGRMHGMCAQLLATCKIPKDARSALKMLMGGMRGKIQGALQGFMNQGRNMIGQARGQMQHDYNQAQAFGQQQYAQGRGQLQQQYNQAQAFGQQQYGQANSKMHQQYNQAQTFGQQQYGQANSKMHQQYNQAQAFGQQQYGQVNSKMHQQYNQAQGFGQQQYGQANTKVQQQYNQAQGFGQQQYAQTPGGMPSSW